MNPPIYKTCISLALRSLQLAGSLALVGFAVSCSEPPEKPVPELNPASVAKKESLKEAKGPAPATAKKSGRVTRMTIGDLYQLSQNNAVLIYDARPKLIYSLGHIPDAISWPESQFEKDLAKHEPNISAASKANKPIVIYCTDLACPDATVVATSLAQRGYDVSILQGGYQAWKTTSRISTQYLFKSIT